MENISFESAKNLVERLSLIGDQVETSGDDTACFGTQKNGGCVLLVGSVALSVNYEVGGDVGISGKGCTRTIEGAKTISYSLSKDALAECEKLPHTGAYIDQKTKDGGVVSGIDFEQGVVIIRFRDWMNNKVKDDLSISFSNFGGQG